MKKSSLTCIAVQLAQNEQMLNHAGLREIHGATDCGDLVTPRQGWRVGVKELY